MCEKLATAAVLVPAHAEFRHFSLFAEDGKEMYKDLWRTCTAIVLLIKPFASWRSRRRFPSWFSLLHPQRSKRSLYQSAVRSVPQAQSRKDRLPPGRVLPPSPVTLCLHLHYSADPTHPKKNKTKNVWASTERGRGLLKVPNHWLSCTESHS